MPSLDIRQKTPFTAQGVDSTVVVHTDKVVVKTRGVGRILKRAISTVTDPSSNQAGAYSSDTVPVFA